MKKFLLLLPIPILFASFVFLVFKDKIFKTAKAGLQVESTPQARLFLDGQEVGTTPYQSGELREGEKVVRLVPEENLSPWETKINLTEGTLSYVYRKFDSSESSSSAKIVTLEKLADKKAKALMVISTPDSSLVRVDGEEKGKTPLSLDNLTEGEHEVNLSSPGFEEMQINTRVTNGFRINLNFKLAEKQEISLPKEKENEEKAEEEKSDDLTKPYVLIKETPTGWLRVRLEPSVNASEAAKVKPGEKYPFLEEESGWFKISYEEGKEGWISGQYASKVE